MLKFKTCFGIDLVTCDSIVELVTNEKFNQYLDDYQFDNEKEISGNIIHDLVQHRWIINMDVLSLKWKDLMKESYEWKDLMNENKEK